MNVQFATNASFSGFLAALAPAAEVFVPRAAERALCWQGLPPAAGSARVTTSWQRLAPGEGYRATAVRVDHPAKGFFFAAQEGVGRYPAGRPLEPEARRRVIVGAKACDLVALKTYDAVFGGGEVKDDFYLARRRNTLLFAADCPAPIETCWCAMLGGKPWAVEGFDLSLAAVEGGQLAEAGSDAGRELLEKHRAFFIDASGEQLAGRDAARRRAEQRLKEINAGFETASARQKLVKRQDRAGKWLEGVATCVECGACLFACPTCHCFLLHDYPAEGGGAVRAKAWDGCIYGGYHLMAGGGSPRADLVKRFRNRWMHKFDYFVDLFGLESCSGCGRCIGCCPGQIDLRKVLKSLEGA